MAKRKFPYYLLLSLIGCHSPERQLTKEWPEKKPLLTTAVVAKGYILTITRDTLKGLVHVNPGYPLDHISLLPANKSTSSDIIEVKTDDIDCISLESFEGRVAMDYMPVKFKMNKRPHLKPHDGKPLVEQARLFQILGTKGQSRLGYREWGATDADGNWYYTGVLILVSKDSIHILSNGAVGLESIPAFLLKFINKRYKQHFSRDMYEKSRINYILDRET